MNAECPKCRSQDFDVLDQDFDLTTCDYKLAEFVCICTNCSKNFLIQVSMEILRIS